jgi:1,4-alpha-glucan branching enzyme
MHTGLSALTTERASVPYATTTDGRRVTRRRIDRSEMQGETCCSMYRTLGAHPDVVDGAAGTRFAVWAPNAADVSVVCNANGWKPGQNRLWGSDSGIWSGFVPGMKHGDVYKYIIRTRDNRSLEKSDPVAFYAEVPPRTASIVYQLPNFPWQDGNWMQKRAHTNWFERPISIYEVHLGSWRRPKDGRRYLSYRELAQQLVDYTHEMGYTHLQLMPLCEFPYDGSWGYQTTGYFAPTSRFGTPDDFMHFVDYCHQADVGVIIDWVPAHFPCDGHALGHFDGTAVYEHSDPRQGMHPDWGTYIFNYGRSEVRDFLLSSARFWLETYHVDGLRVDAVASMLYLDYSRKAGEWIPNRYGGRENLEAIQFLKDLNVHLHGAFPGVLTIAEESTAWGGVSAPVYNGGLGFSMKWDMGWMNDTLRYLRHEPVHRKFHQNELSFRMVYAFTENFILPLSHDEVVHGKRSLISQMPGDYWQQFASLRLLYGYQYTMPGKKLLFMGGEFGQWTEWNYDAELDWALFGHKYHDSLRRYVGDLNRVYRSEPALYEIDFRSEGFRWIQADDYQNSVYAYYRIAKDPNDIVVVLENFTPVPRQAYRVGVPRAGCYREIINSDAAIYGGSNLGNAGAVYTEPIPAHGHAQSLSLTLPPLAMLMLKPV